MKTIYVIATSADNFSIIEDDKIIGNVKPENNGYISHWTGHRFTGIRIWFSTAKRAIDAMIVPDSEVHFKNEYQNLKNKNDANV